MSGVALAQTLRTSSTPALAAEMLPPGVRLRVCADAGCQTGPETLVTWPAGARDPLRKAHLRLVNLGHGRSAIHVRVPVAKPAETSAEAPPTYDHVWELLAAAKPGDGAPRVLYAGPTGWVEGEPGERRGTSLWFRPGRDSAEVVSLGDEQEDVQLCGRPTLLAPKLLDTEQLEFRSVKLQRLAHRERQQAKSLLAERVERTLGPQLLHARVASSAIGSPQALTDGNLETTWAEGRSGSGLGEFAVLRAPAELPIVGLDFVFRPPSRELERGAAPRQFWLASDETLYRVHVPDGAWQPGAVYSVTLPNPLHTSCLSLVMESAQDAGPDPDVSFAEVSARTAFDFAESGGVLAALGRGGPLAKAAALALEDADDETRAEVLSAFPRLSAEAQALALDVVDQTHCAQGSDFHVGALLGEYRVDRERSRRYLTRCGAVAASSLAEALPRAKGTALAAMAEQLRRSLSQTPAEGSSDEPLATLTTLLDREDADERRGLRDALRRMADQPRFVPWLRAQLTRVDLNPRQRLELLRALGSKAPELLPQAGAVFQELARAGEAVDFDMAYQLLPVASALLGREPQAHGFMRSMFSSDSPYLRARVAALAPAEAFTSELVSALSDEQMRVRLAAAQSLRRDAPAVAIQPLLQRLALDPWPAVRAAAALGLGQERRSGGLAREILQALQKAVTEDASANVRRVAINVLGERQAVGVAPLLRERLREGNEDPQVRAAAATALADLCAADSVEVLTDYALLLTLPAGGEAERVVGRAAFLALFRLQPADLQDRLADFERPENQWAKRLLEGIKASERCPRSAASR